MNNDAAQHHGRATAKVHLITDTGVRECAQDELPTLLAAGKGLVWVDIPVWDEASADLLREIFGFHPLALRDCAIRNRIPKVHAYTDTLFIILHAPERGDGGHVHFVELDRFIGPGYLVTVHGPLNPAVPLGVALRDTNDVLERVRSQRLRPKSSFELSHAIVSTLARRMEALLETLTQDVWDLEKKVTAAQIGEPEAFLDEMFRARHGLLAVRTIAAQSQEIYQRIHTLSRFIPPDSRPLVGDLIDQYGRIKGLAEEEKDYLQGVIEFYRARTDTKMTIAAERLAVIAVVTLPITALASLLGMNLIVNEHTTPVPLVISLAVMIAMSATLLTWAKRRGWW
jgi:magnesium transporter